MAILLQLMSPPASDFILYLNYNWKQNVIYTMSDSSSLNLLCQDFVVQTIHLQLKQEDIQILLYNNGIVTFVNKEMY